MYTCYQTGTQAPCLGQHWQRIKVYVSAGLSQVGGREQKGFSRQPFPWKSHPQQDVKS